MEKTALGKLEKLTNPLLNKHEKTCLPVNKITSIHMTREEFVLCTFLSLQAFITITEIPREEAIRRAIDYAQALKAEFKKTEF